MTNNVEMWTLLVGFLLPPVLAALMKTSWTPYLKSALAFLACVVAALVTVLAAGDLDFGDGDWISAILLVLTTAQATYHGFWKPTGIAPKIAEASPVTGSDA